MKKTKKIFNTIFIIIIILIILISSIILINSYTHSNEIPDFFGWKAFIVLSGSMEPQIQIGDIVVVKEIDTDTLKKGDIIAFKSTDTIITHRIIQIINEVNQTKYITKGDNNNIQDEEYILPENVEGIYKFKISQLGNIIIFMQTSRGKIACLSIFILLLFIEQFSEKRRKKT